ncbi:MAG: hypothetical protein OK422_06340 [Thaumarchaeota archaeon]|nr:hypothetical protein [Nitrososphaerota archaeon]
MTKYPAQNYISIVGDQSGHLWAAIDEYNSPNYYLEVQEISLQAAYASSATAAPWNSVYVSPALTYDPIPQLIALPNGDIILDYISSSSACSGDYFVYTTNLGQSWTVPTGPVSAAGSPLCYASSSGTYVGDTAFFGGRNSAGNLAWWSYNFDTLALSSASSAVATGIDSGAMSSIGGNLVMAYDKFASGSGEQLSIAYSYDAGNTWFFTTTPFYFKLQVTLPLVSSSFQIAAIGSTYSTSYYDAAFFTL